MTHLIDGERMPRKVFLKKMRRAERGNCVVKEDADRAGDDKRNEALEGFGADTAKLAGVNDGDWHGKTDIGKERCLANDAVLRENAADGERRTVAWAPGSGFLRGQAWRWQ